MAFNLRDALLPIAFLKKSCQNWLYGPPLRPLFRPMHDSKMISVSKLDAILWIVYVDPDTAKLLAKLLWEPVMIVDTSNDSRVAEFNASAFILLDLGPRSSSG